MVFTPDGIQSNRKGVEQLDSLSAPAAGHGFWMDYSLTNWCSCQSVIVSPFGRIKEAEYSHPAAAATFFSSAGVKPSRFIFWLNACGLDPYRRANSETLIFSLTQRIFICSDVDKLITSLLIKIINENVFNSN